MVVKDVQAVDSTVSRTITSSCREEAKQIGWHKRLAKREAEPLGTIHPAKIQSLISAQPRELPSPLEGSRFAGQAGRTAVFRKQETEEAAPHPQPGSMPRSKQLPTQRASSEVSKKYKTL